MLLGNLSVSSFPTFYFARKGHKAEPLLYEVSICFQNSLFASPLNAHYLSYQQLHQML